MSVRNPVWAVWGAIQLVTLASRAAPNAAEPSPTLVSIDYRAPLGCPERDDFIGQVLQRLSRVRVEARPAAERHFDVRVEAAPPRIRATLEFVDADARRVQRQLVADACGEAVSGIALVTALAIDPRLSLSENEAEVELAAGPTSNDDTEAASTEPSDAPALPIRSEAAVPPQRDTGERKRRAEPRRWTWLIGAAAGTVTDVAPGLAPSGELFTELGPGSDLRVRLTASYTDSGERELASGIVRFRLAQARTELCPIAARIGGSVALWPCAALEVGGIRGEGARSPRLSEPKTTSGVWFAGLAALRAALALGETFSMEVQGQVRVPFLRRSYVFERPELLTYQTPAVGGGVLVGVTAALMP